MSNISSFCFSYPGHTTRRRTILYPIYARSGIRTREANATDLKSVPFDRSGIRAKYIHLDHSIICNLSLYGEEDNL